MTGRRPTTRVLHVLEALEGGTARHLVDVVRWTPAIEHHVVVPARRVGGLTDMRAIPELRSLGAAVHPVSMTRRPVSRSNARALGAVHRLVVAVRPDVVHTHSSIGGLLGRVVARRHRIPSVYTPNGITDVRAGLLVERALARATGRFVAVSASEAVRARQLRLADGHRLAVIVNGIDLTAPPEPIALRPMLGLADDAVLVGTVSRLVAQKDPLTWIRMAAEVHRRRPDAHFVVIGDGPLRSAVDAEIASSGIGSRVHVVAELPGAAGALADLDVFVMTSMFEGAPYAPMEAMAAGVPVVLTDVVGNADLVVDGADGHLVPAGDPLAAATRVIALLDDPDAARVIGERGASTVAERFSVQAMGDSLVALYEELAGSGAAG